MTSYQEGQVKPKVIIDEEITAGIRDAVTRREGMMGQTLK